CEGQIEKPALMILDSEAKTKFFEWRNQIYSFKDQLPAQLRGFLPKAVEYVLRLTGVIHCLQMFSAGSTPQLILSVEDLERGIKAVSFYMGQIQGAVRLIEEEGYAPPEISERSLLLAQTLHQLRPHLQDGRLAVGFIHKHYNLTAPKTQKISKPKGMGAVLRAAMLTMAPGKHDANGHRGVSCLQWDKNTESFIEQRLQCLQSQKSQDWQGFDDADVEARMSASSAGPAEGFKDNADISKRMSAPETCISIEPQHNADVADMVLTKEKQRIFKDTPLVQCENCQNFTASSDAPWGRGYCHLHEKSWNGKMTQFSGDLHPCLSFDVKDSIKVLAAWDEAIGQMVHEAVQTHGLG
ncbi:MAG: hypothetical protein NTY36_00390, partial [Deltaproteobacteria bacterium]|nr:hypothetical protein [Deltaproteobacteria bacterium]